MLLRVFEVNNGDDRRVNFSILLEVGQPRVPTAVQIIQVLDRSEIVGALIYSLDQLVHFDPSKNIR